MTELETTSKAAGLTDPDMLRLVAPGADPRQAVADLKRRYPTAVPLEVCNLSDAEYKIAEAQRRAVLATGQYTKRQATWFRHQPLTDPPWTHTIHARYAILE